MSAFEHAVNSEIAAGKLHSNILKVVCEATEQAVRSLLNVSESLPYVGTVAKLINGAIHICDQCKCNKDAFQQLKVRLYRFTQLLLDKGGLAAAASERSQTAILTTFVTRLEETMNAAICELKCFAKVGFLSSLLVGSKPAKCFNQLDADLTGCLPE
jgi:hypothetical protein